MPARKPTAKVIPVEIAKLPQRLLRRRERREHADERALDALPRAPGDGLRDVGLDAGTALYLRDVPRVVLAVRVKAPFGHRIGDEGDLLVSQGAPTLKCGHPGRGQIAREPPAQAVVFKLGEVPAGSRRRPRPVRRATPHTTARQTPGRARHGPTPSTG